MERVSNQVIAALEEQLYTWALFSATGTGNCGTSPIYALMMGRVQSARCGSVVLVDDSQAAEIDSAMAKVKRESPEQYRVLSVEAYSLLGGDSLALQRSRARRLRMSERTYRRHLQSARLFLAALLFGPRWAVSAEELAA
ncbi:hypothetical protein GCM10008940_06460 [Microbulbifer agarilyticus]